MLNVGALADRTMGEYPLSIATSLAIEGAMGNHPDHPTNHNALSEYDELWVNLKTIFRNLYNAIPREDVLTVRPSDFYDALVVEVDQLVRVIESETNARMKVVFYVSDYAGMEIKYPHAHLRGDTTPLQKAYTAAMIATLGPYIQNHRDQIKMYKLLIKDISENKVLLLTHFPIDLTTKSIRRLALLESHTGTVKQRHQWYTKFHNGRDLPMIPFNIAFLQVFGDEQHFRPMSISVRKTIIELAQKYNWSQATTYDKIKYGLDQLKDHFLRDKLRALFH